MVQRPKTPLLAERGDKSANGTLRTWTPTLSISTLGGEADIPDPRSSVRYDLNRRALSRASWASLPEIFLALRFLSASFT
jgi:hypothetical protein